MNEEFYSIGRGSLNINGKFYYGLDYQITDFMRNLDQENQQLKLQYCERADCSGRIGNSKKIEQLETEKEQLNNLVNSCQEEIRRLKKENQQLKSKIDKAFQLLQVLHYKFDDNDAIHNEIEDIQKILKE